MEVAASLRQPKRDVKAPRLAACTHRQPAFLENFQHLPVVGQHVGNQFPQAGSARNRNEMPHQRPANTLSLISVDHGECHLGLPRFHDNIPSTTYDNGLAVFFHRRDQGDVINKIHIDEELGLLLAELPFHGEETPVEGIRADTADRCDEIVPISGAKGADFDPTSVSQGLNFRILS